MARPQHAAVNVDQLFRQGHAIRPPCQIPGLHSLFLESMAAKKAVFPPAGGARRTPRERSKSPEVISEDEAEPGMTSRLSAGIASFVDQGDVRAVKGLLYQTQLYQDDDIVQQAVNTAADHDGNTPLHRCAAKEGIDGSTTHAIAQLLVQSRASVDSTNMLGETPLLLAVRRAPVPMELLQQLLQARANPGHADAVTGDTALMEAACAGNADLLCLLLDWGADPRRRNTAGLTAWHMATTAGHRQVAALMPEAEEPMPEPSLAARLRAAVKSCDHTELASHLAQAGTAAATAAVQAADGSGRTLLHLCAEVAMPGCVATARLLLAHAAAVNAVDGFGQRPLQLAAMGSATPATELVQVLLDARADTSGLKLPPGASPELRERLRPPPVTQAASAKHSAPEPASPPVQEAMEEAEEEGKDAREEAREEESEERRPQARPQPRGQGLRSWCQEHDVPFSLLGSLGASDLRRELERLEPLTAEQLRDEARAKDLCYDPCISREGLYSMLKQWRIWKLMPLEALQAECQRKAAHVVHRQQLGDGGVAMARQELEEALAVAAWGGTTRAQRVLDLCAVKQIPVHQLQDLQKAEELLAKLEVVEAKGLSELRSEYRERGLAPNSTWTRQQFVEGLRQYFVYEAQSLSGLQQACRKANVEVPGWFCRGDLLRLLRQETWRARGVPIERLPDSASAFAVLEQVELLQQRITLQDLTRLCIAKGVPVEDRPVKAQLVARLREAVIWEAIPLEGLRQELAPQLSRPEAVRGMQRLQLVSLLSCASFLSLKGAPLQRLIIDLGQAAGYYLELDQLTGKKDSEVSDVYATFLPLERCVDRALMMERLRKIVLWQCLTTEEQRKECEGRGIRVVQDRSQSENSYREEMLQRLQEHMMMQAWKARGIPVESLGPYDACGRLVQIYEWLDNASLQELQDICIKLDVPVAAHRDRLVERLKWIELWIALPFQELRRECRKYGLGVPNVPPNDELRTALAAGLARARLTGSTPGPRPKAAPGPRPKAATGPRPKAVPPPRPAGPSAPYVSPKIRGAFGVLQLPTSADANEVRRAYRQLALQWHPDKNPELMKTEAETKFRQLSAAYQDICEYLRLQKR